MPTDIILLLLNNEYNLILQLLKILQNTSLDIKGIHIEFDSNGNPNIGYNLIEWVWKGSYLEFIPVGSYEHGLFINKSLFEWHTENKEVLTETH